MAEVEYQGIKLSGGKLLFVLPLLGTLAGGLWGGFEFYKDYMDMKDKIANYVAPDLSAIDRQQAVMEAEFAALKVEDEAMTELVRTEVNALKQSVSEMKSDVHDIKMELKDDITGLFDNLDKQDERNRNNVEDVRGIINSFEIRMDRKVDVLDSKIETLQGNVDKKIRQALDNPLANGG